MCSSLPDGRSPLLDDLLGARWQRPADRQREFEKYLVAGELLEALVDEAACAVDVASLVRKPCLEERELGSAEGSVLDQSIESVLDAIAHQLAEQHVVPLAQGGGPPVPIPVGAGPLAIRFRRAVASDQVERPPCVSPDRPDNQDMGP